MLRLPEEPNAEPGIFKVVVVYSVVMVEKPGNSNHKAEHAAREWSKQTKVDINQSIKVQKGTGKI